MGRKRNRPRPPPARPPPGASVVDIIKWLGHCGAILLLFETPSGFALFSYDGIKLLDPKAMQNIWADFAKDYTAEDIVFLKEFQVFEDKAGAINFEIGVSDRLAKMIKRHIRPGQKLAVGKEDYRTIIESRLKISCLFDEPVMEVMWGLNNLMKSLVPKEKLKLTEEDSRHTSKGMEMVLKRHGFDVKPDMVSRHIIDLAYALHECDLCVDKYSGSLRSVGDIIQKVSGINTQNWSLQKVASALNIICSLNSTYDHKMFSDEEVSKILVGLSQYDEKIFKKTCLEVYKEIVWADGVKNKTKQLLRSLVGGSSAA